MSDEVIWAPIIPPSARPYLEIQQGRISDLRGKEWDRAYGQQLRDTAKAIAPFIPQPLGAILDIGGGMGGIDALLVAQFGTPETHVAILDGLACKPTVADHDQPYSSGPEATAFLRANGVRRSTMLTCELGKDPAAFAQLSPTVDLVLSVQAWCFHFEPRIYCAAAMAVSKPGTRWILDVRNDRAHWAAYLFATPRLNPVEEVEGFTDKYTRMIFEVE